MRKSNFVMVYVLPLLFDSFCSGSSDSHLPIAYGADQVSWVVRHSGQDLLFGRDVFFPGFLSETSYLAGSAFGNGVESFPLFLSFSFLGPFRGVANRPIADSVVCSAPGVFRHDFTSE